MMGGKRKNPLVRLVLITVSMTMSKAGSGSWKSQKTIAADAGVSLSTAKRALKWAERNGWVKHVAQIVPGREWSHNEYSAVVPAHVYQLMEDRVQQTLTTLGPVAPEIGSRGTEIGSQLDPLSLQETLQEPLQEKYTERVSERERLAKMDRMKAIYPQGLYPQAKWLDVERLIEQREQEGTSFDELLAGAERYAAQCASKGGGRQYVMSPVKFFQRRERLWTEEWPKVQRPESIHELMARLNREADEAGEPML